MEPVEALARALYAEHIEAAYLHPEDADSFDELEEEDRVEYLTRAARMIA